MTFNFEIKNDEILSNSIINSTSVKRQHVEENHDLDLIEIVNILGDLLSKVKESINNKKESYVPSAAVSFLLRRMDVDTHDLLSEEFYCSMTSFMTVYLCFIQYLLQNDFTIFMDLFSTHDSFLVEQNQPFLWYYVLHHRSILEEMHRRFTLSNTKFDTDLILSKIDFIFTKFYTLHFLESCAQKHQKDHGQFYTPQSIIQFMWDKCIPLSHFITCLQNNDLPSVFDPCLGMGSFLCEFLSRCIQVCRFTVWNDPHYLTTLLVQLIPDQIWGVEIDPFAYQLCKLNMMVHLFPLYQRLKELGVFLQPGSIHRLKLFCNDTLKLQIQTNPFFTNDVDPFEEHCLNLLRQPTLLKFDFIVTNPPYMIRKTGFITQADPIIYDEHVLGSRGTQAYLYFLWIALQRCDDKRGQVCLITPSQWTVLEFAQHLREWIWTHCKLLDMYEFEPYKVWPKVQTDSLIFRICKQTTTLPNTDYTLYLRHVSRKITLTELLQVYQNFRLGQPHLDKDLKWKCTPTRVPNVPLRTKHASFSFISPNASCLEELEAITGHLPRLCDEESTRSHPSSAPLLWNRGPNTNPVYSLVVRTSWAYATFGPEVCAQFLKPCFYWNGKTMARGGGKEGKFWKSRDPLRLGKKETSAAEAYWPYYCTLDENPDRPFYSLILVNRDDALKLANTQDPSLTPFIEYLRDARVALQPDKTDTLVNCQYNKCGVGVPVKIVHPINCGYFTRSQPRQRFFVDTQELCVTNQCIYFTIKPGCEWQDADFFCGLLNSLLIQFFTKVHCCYDQQGRMRYFGRSMAYIPFCPPSSKDAMDAVAMLVQGMTLVRTWLYAYIRHANHHQKLMERVRNGEWRSVVEEELDALLPITKPDTTQFVCPVHLQWLDEFASAHCYQHKKSVFMALLKIASLFQYAVDQMIYSLYRVPEHVQLELEQDLNAEGLRKEWVGEIDIQFNNDRLVENYQQVIEHAISIVGSLDLK